MASTPNPEDAPLRAIGAALSNWSLVELQIASLFSTLSSIPDQRKSYAIFDGIVSFEVRLGLCDRLMEFETVDEVEAEMWRRLSARLGKFYKKRHQLAHFSMIQENDGNITISPFFNWTKLNDGGGARLSVEDIRMRSDKFIELHMAVCWFIQRAVYRLAEPSPVELLDLQEPPLVPRLRDAAIQILEAKKQHPSPFQG